MARILLIGITPLLLFSCWTPLKDWDGSRKKVSEKISLGANRGKFKDDYFRFEFNLKNSFNENLFFNGKGECSYVSHDSEGKLVGKKGFELVSPGWNKVVFDCLIDEQALADGIVLKLPPLESRKNKKVLQEPIDWQLSPSKVSDNLPHPAISFGLKLTPLSFHAENFYVSSLGLESIIWTNKFLGVLLGHDRGTIAKSGVGTLTNTSNSSLYFANSLGIRWLSNIGFFLDSGFRYQHFASEIFHAADSSGEVPDTFLGNVELNSLGLFGSLGYRLQLGASQVAFIFKADFYRPLRYLDKKMNFKDDGNFEGEKIRVRNALDKASHFSPGIFIVELSI